MDCLTRRDLMPEFLLGLLDPEEQVELARHLATGCPACAGARAEAEVALASLPQTLELRAPAPELRHAACWAASPLPTRLPVRACCPG